MNPFLTLIQEGGTKSKDSALSSVLMHGYLGKFSSEAYQAHYDLTIKQRIDKLIGEWARASTAYRAGESKIKPMSLDELTIFIQKLKEEDRKSKIGMASGGYISGGKVKIPGYAGGAYVNPTYSANMSIPKFETGINSVPADMLAMLHKNEAVIPANMNPFNPNANNATMGGATFNITNNINGFDGDINQLSRMVTQQTVSAIKSLDGRTASMAGPNLNVGISA